MELSKYIELILTQLPKNTKTNFDIEVSHIKGKIYVKAYGLNKIKFNIIKKEI